MSKTQSAALLRLLLLTGILLGVNLLSTRFHYGLDLTAEGRFTLSPATKTMLRSLNEPVVVDVYLAGDNLPPLTQRLRDAVRERLDAFRDKSNSRFIVRFSDPLEGKKEGDKDALIRSLADRGVFGVMANRRSSSDAATKMIFPYAEVRIGDNKIAVRLLETSVAGDDVRKLAASESLLEYKLASAIRNLRRPAAPKVFWITGHGEALGPQTYDALTSLGEQYDLDTFDLTSHPYIPSIANAIIICKPTDTIKEVEKFKIDQYVMNGGSVLWYVDPIRASMDSLLHAEQSLAVPADLNIDDMLFKYGARLNNDLIEDLNCNPISVVVGRTPSGGPQLQNYGWPFFPVLLPTARHPIVNNMGPLMSVFASSIDTIAAPGIHKTILLESSKYSRTQAAPVLISLNTLRYEPKPELFNKPFRPLAVLLEGTFRSVFENRLTPQFLHNYEEALKRPFKGKTDSNARMIVVADGDMALNNFTATEPYPMGFWRDGGVQYSNKDFFLNCIEYLTDRSGLLEARSKDLRPRLLDAKRVEDEKSTWQALSIGLPLLLLAVFASAYLFFRKRRYGSPIAAALKKG